VEQARKLVESDEVLLVFNSLGTPPNTAIQKYLNTKKVPQLFVATGATKWNDPKDFPWTMGWQPNYQSESQIYAKYILKNNPNGKIAVLYPERRLRQGLSERLQGRARRQGGVDDRHRGSYEVSEPTIDSHIVKMKSTGADIFFNITTPKFAAQAIKKNAEIGWKPLHFLNNVSGSIGSVMKPAGFENGQDIISSQYFKDPTDAQWKNDAAMKAWNEFLDKYYPEANRADASVMYAYIVSQGLVHVLKACGDDLTRANVMKQAASIKDLEVGGLLPGVKVNTSPTDFAPLSQLQLIRFKGETWERFGEILSGDVGG
jgi:branched-chain amino acid transport system substrate-binding protein